MKDYSFGDETIRFKSCDRRYKERIKSFGYVAFKSEANEEFMPDEITCPVCSDHPKMERFGVGIYKGAEGNYHEDEFLSGAKTTISMSHQEMILKLRCPKCGSILRIPLNAEEYNHTWRTCTLDDDD